MPGPARLAAAASFFVAAVPGTGPAPFPLRAAAPPARHPSSSASVSSAPPRRLRGAGIGVPGSAHRVAGSSGHRVGQPAPFVPWRRTRAAGAHGCAAEGRPSTFERKTAQTLGSPPRALRRRSDGALLARGVPARSRPRFPASRLGSSGADRPLPCAARFRRSLSALPRQPGPARREPLCPR